MHELIEKAINEFKNLDDKPIRILSHLDSDGLTAASIISKALFRENKKFVLSIVKQLNENVLNELSLENYNTIIFTDLGSGYLTLINKYLFNKKVFIFDHHNPENNKDYENIIQVNPHLSLIKEASNKISGAGVVYLFAKNLNKINMDLSYLALIGATGDIQNFENLNKEILDDAVSQGKVLIKYGLKMFGSQTKPLSKLLQYSTDPYIPGVTGSEEGTFQFLNEIGIEAMQDGKFKKIIDLSDNDLKTLTTAIIVRRLGSEKTPEDIFGNIYILKDETQEGLKDIREFSTTLNCCGRLGKPSIGIGVCLDNSVLKEKANELLRQYKLEIINGLNWFYANKSNLIHGENFVVINAQSNIRDTLIGTITSIVAKSNLYKDGTILIGMAYTIDNKVKLSVRGTNHSNNNLVEIMSKVVEGYGEIGGHKDACGGSIGIEDELKFINKVKECLG